MPSSASVSRQPATARQLLLAFRDGRRDGWRVKSDRGLPEKLRKIERLHAQASTEGERLAAAAALERLQARLPKTPSKPARPRAAMAEPLEEYRFVLVDAWSQQLLEALLAHHGVATHRRPRQRRHTVLAWVSRRWVEATLWPQFLTWSETLQGQLAATTRRVIAQATAPTRQA